VRFLRWASIASGSSLALQLAISYMGLEAPFHKEWEENKDPNMTFREEQGKTKLVPLIPKPKVGELPSTPYTKEEVAKHDSREDAWVVINGYVYDVSRFVEKHPGGWLPIVNMAGKDCTDAFENYHPAKVTTHMLPCYCVGKLTDYTVAPHVAEFRAVRQELLRRGWFETDMRFYWKIGTSLFFEFVSALYLSLGGTNVPTRLAGGFLMGIFWQQLAGIGHDFGHAEGTHVMMVDHAISSFCSSLMGLSTCWWKRNHNCHHVTCNSVEHDPDIQHMPILAVTPKIFAKPFWSTYYKKWVSMDALARLLVSYQHLVFYPMMCLARFNLYQLSWRQLLSSEPIHYRKTEICGMLIYLGWVAKVALSMSSPAESIGWLFISHASAGLLHVQIVVSHWAMATYHGHAYNDDKDEWYTTQIKTTMNVLTPEWLDWVHIGLQYQIEHHLMPRLPRQKFRKVTEMVQPICEKYDIPYHYVDFYQANKETILALKETAQHARHSKRGSHGFYESALWDGMQLVG